jgi:hypothetical protein
MMSTVATHVQAKASFKKFTQRFEKEKTKKDDFGDDYGAYCNELLELDLRCDISPPYPWPLALQCCVIKRQHPGSFFAHAHAHAYIQLQRP